MMICVLCVLGTRCRTTEPDNVFSCPKMSLIIQISTFIWNPADKVWNAIPSREHAVSSLPHRDEWISSTLPYGTESWKKWKYTLSTFEAHFKYSWKYTLGTIGSLVSPTTTKHRFFCVFNLNRDLLLRCNRTLVKPDTIVNTDLIHSTFETHFIKTLTLKLYGDFDRCSFPKREGTEQVHQLLFKTFPSDLVLTNAKLLDLPLYLSFILDTLWLR